MYDDLNKLRNITTNYLARGKDLLRRCNLHTTSDSTLPKDISRWILETIEELLQLMSSDHQDFNKLDEIKTQYMNNQSILRTSAEADIYKVLKNIAIVHDRVLASMNADYKDLSPENMAHINYERLKRAYNYLKKNLIKDLEGKENGVTYRTTILNIYGKIYFWIQSMVRLDGPQHCLALAASVRAILELYVDLNLIKQSKITNGAEKYFSFSTVEKWRSAKSIVKMRNQYHLNITNETTAEDEYLNDPEHSDSNIEAIRTKLWGKTKSRKPVMPIHWTNLNLRERVELLDDPDIVDRYISSYYWCNWCVHSMYFDMICNLKNVNLFNWHLYELAYKMFRPSTELANKIIEVLPKEDLEDSFKNIENEHFKCFFDEMVNACRSRKGYMSFKQ